MATRLPLLSFALLVPILVGCNGSSGDGDPEGRDFIGTGGGGDRDLRVTGISLDPALPSKNQEFTVTATIANNGGDPANGFAVELSIRDGGDELASQTSATTLAVSAGGTVTQRFTVTPEADGSASGFKLTGLLDFVVTVDSNNGVAENDEDNNERSETHTAVDALAVGPDLLIEFDPISPVSPLPGDTVSVPFTVRNQGSQATGSFVLRCEAFSSTGTSINPVTESVSLSAGGTTTRTYQFTAGLGAGAYTVEISPDDTGVVTELIESNNLDPQTIGIGVVIPKASN